ncbi:MAG: CCA tRNA nucleotidyltransferase [Magnetococcales bacterium]|nr:CCA tRNA nucleotidyltransferase [Magnetococcales bacterium]
MEVLFHKEFSPYIQTLLDELGRLIGPVHLIGGAVRNGLRRKSPPPELGILVPRPLPECQKKLTEQGYEDVAPGNKHNSLLLPLKRKEHPKTVEISTFRHRPGHTPTVEEDLFHRDLTINALAFRWPEGPLIDPFNGSDDLLARRIRLVNGAETLKADPLRALRFFRFAFQLSGVPDPEHLSLCENICLDAAPQRRVRAELDRIFSLPLRDGYSNHMMYRLFQSKMGRKMLPELEALEQIHDEETGQSEWKHTLEAMMSLSIPMEDEEIPLFDLRWATLLQDISQRKKGERLVESEGSIEAAILDRFHFTRRRKRRIMILLQNLDQGFTPTERVLKRLIDSHIPVEGLYRLQKSLFETLPYHSSDERQELEKDFHRVMKRCSAMRVNINRLSPKQLAISGGEIQDLVGITPGPWLGKVQRILVDWVTEDRSRNRPRLLEKRVQQWIQNEQDEF